MKINSLKFNGRASAALSDFGMRLGAAWPLLAALAGLLWLPISAGASTTISQGYATSTPLAMGSIVSLENNTSDRVVPAGANNVENLLGVVISAESSLLAVSNPKDTQVQVATGGRVAVLVSDINGAVKKGDHITASPVNGVGMRASSNVRVIGVAQGDAPAGTKQTYKEKNGTERSVNLSEVPVLVNVAYYFKEPERTIVPGAVQNVANALAGREVSTVPVLISAGIFLITLMIVTAIIYSMIKSSIISVGRNPMSQSAIYRDLIQLSALVLAILGVGMTAIYLVLTRL